MASSSSRGSALSLSVLRHGLLLLPFGVAVADNVVSITSTDSHHLVVVDKLSRRFIDYQKLEHVVMISPYDPSVRQIVRVTQTEREWVKVVVDDGEFMAFVPKGYLWCEGGPTDSRDFGPSPKGLVVGRPMARFLSHTPLVAHPERRGGTVTPARPPSAAKHQDMPVNDQGSSHGKVDTASVPSPDVGKT